MTEEKSSSKTRAQSSLRRRSTSQLHMKSNFSKDTTTTEPKRKISTALIPPLNMINQRKSNSKMQHLSVDRDVESIHSGTAISRSTSMCSVDSYRYSSKKHKVQNSSRCTSSLSGIGSLEKSTSRIWQEFEEHILSIDTDSMHFQTKPTTSKGSETLKGLLEEEYLRKNGFPLTVNKFLKVNKFKENILSNTLVESTNEDEEEECTKRISDDECKTQRQWNKVKIDVQEKHLEKKLAEPVDGWKLISQTAPYITDAQKARRVLYERYIDNPNAWLEGLQSYDKYRHILEDHESNSMKGAFTHRKTISKELDMLEKRPKSSYELAKSKIKDKKHKSIGQKTNRPLTAVVVF